MSLNLTGKHLIDGQWVGDGDTFASRPAHGAAREFHVATASEVNAACTAAEDAFWSFGYSRRQERAQFLETIANEIEARANDVTQIGSQETGLPEARLQGERGRTVGQLRLFAKHILQGDYLDRRHDVALPDRAPLPRPDLKMLQRPVGPVAIFGSSNFPLAFSTAGGDTASALAAGCPVVVKGHGAHPGTGEIIAQAIHAAVENCGLHPGVFSFVQGHENTVGETLVQHPLISAVGFTGSLRGGRALFDLCAARPMPIPFFGELGSINPVFLLPEATRARATEIGAAWAASLTMGAGQFCTNPGLVIVHEGAHGDAFVSAAKQALSETANQTMLTEGIANAYQSGVSKVQSNTDVTEITGAQCGPRDAAPFVFQVSAETWLSDDTLSEEVFGPMGIIVRVTSDTQMSEIARRLNGQLTATLQMDDGDMNLAGILVTILERKAGRLLVNGFPTGVEVSDAMVHGGPYPASTNFGATSVGTLAIRRFLRPVCLQNFPSNLLPDEIKN